MRLDGIALCLPAAECSLELHEARRVKTAQEEWLTGWDDTPGIVSVHATQDGRAIVWRRIADTGQLVREVERFQPWLLLAHAADVPRASVPAIAGFEHRELEGPGELRHLVSADDGRSLVSAVLHRASERIGERIGHLSELGQHTVLSLPPEEQYLVATGRAYFRDLPFEKLQRLQFDLETTGLDARRDRIFMISVRYHGGDTEVLEVSDDSPEAEAALIRELMQRVKDADPDVIENHNLHGFDLPFLETRSRALGITLALGRVSGSGLTRRAARRGVLAESSGRDASERRRVRFVAPGRELIDTMDAVRRHDFSTRDFPGHGLKVGQSAMACVEESGVVVAISG